MKTEKSKLNAGAPDRFKSYEIYKVTLLFQSINKHSSKSTVHSLQHFYCLSKYNKNPAFAHSTHNHVMEIILGTQATGVTGKNPCPGGDVPVDDTDSEYLVLKMPIKQEVMSPL